MKDENKIQLKGGFEATDPRLGRIPQFDERSRNFNIRKLFTTDHTEPRSYRWGALVWLDQKSTPECVGYSVSHELASRPKVVKGITEKFASDLYDAAQKLDEWPGENYAGTSVLAGIKAAQALGKIGEYRWAFDTMDLAIAVSYFGPAVIGINWYDSMFTPDANGIITVSGEIAGGHAILVTGFNVGRNVFTMKNSWGVGWGISGNCVISFQDMDRLLSENGEACIITERFL